LQCLNVPREGPAATSCPAPRCPITRPCRNTTDTHPCQQKQRAFKTPKPGPWSSCRHCYIVSIYSGNCRDGGAVPQLEVLAALQRQLCLGLAACALETKHNLLGGLGLLVEDGLSLSTVTGLLPVVTTLSLCEERGLEMGVSIGSLVCGSERSWLPFRPCIG
jgi:hypothetical protein